LGGLSKLEQAHFHTFNVVLHQFMPTNSTKGWSSSQAG